MELNKLTIKQAHQGLIKKQFSSVELTKSCLKSIQKQDKKIKAFLSVTPKLALAQAKKIDKEISTGKKISVLAGIPMAIKDNILVKGIKCTAGSRILKDYIAPYDATVVKKLKNIGAVILGKTNLDEFAMGASTENSGFFTTCNPHDLTRVPGGSSGGSAAAVASNMLIYALGSDTFGSIRQPACFCGVVGLKPTYGAVSRYGLIAMASSLDQIGPITKNIQDAKIVFNAIKGKDPLDSTSIEARYAMSSGHRISENLPITKLRLGVPKEYFIKGINKQVEKIIKNAIEKFAKAGAKIIQISLPHTEYAPASYYITTPSEISANLARYDGIKYGLSTGKNLLDVYLQSRGKGFGDEVRRRIMIGTYALSAGYYDAYYLKAFKVRKLIKQDFNKAFKKVDVIFTPVAPTPAFKIGEKIDDPVAMYLCDIFTGPVNLAGLTAISVPAGMADNLPVGLQIIGKPFEENKILKISEIFTKL